MARGLLGFAAVSVAREILPGRFYLLTRACTQRGFLLKPGRRMNQVFLYCLAEAAQAFGIDVILPTTMSNHHHIVLYDRHGRIVEFYARLHQLVAKAGNALRKRWENFWSSDPPCLVQLLDRADVLAKLVYTAINPVKDGLVERVHQWPGVSGLQALLKRKPIRVKRPPVFFDPDGEMPKEVTLTLTVPPELERGDELRDELAALVTAAEEHYARVRRKTGARVLGRRAVLAQDWRDRPRARAPGGGCGRGSRRATSGDASRRCGGTTRSSRPTAPRASCGWPSDRSRSRPARTGCAASPTSRSPRSPDRRR